MSINLSTTGADNHINWPAGSLIDGAGALSIAFRLRIDEVSNTDRIVQKWAPDQVFLCQISGDEISFLVSDGSSVRFGKTTTGVNLVNGGYYSIVLTWIAGSPGTIHIVVNGIDEPHTNWFTGNPLTLRNSSADFGLGAHAASTAVAGDYEDFALWLEEVPLEVAKAISNGASPLIWPHGMVIHDRLNSIEDAKDIIGGLVPTYFNESNAVNNFARVDVVPFMPISYPQAVGGGVSIPVINYHLRNQGIM